MRQPFFLPEILPITQHPRGQGDPTDGCPVEFFRSIAWLAFTPAAALSTNHALV